MARATPAPRPVLSWMIGVGLQMDDQARRDPSLSGTVPSAREVVATPSQDGEQRETKISGPRTRRAAGAEADAALPIQVGTVLNGKYRIEGVLGEGGVGIVYCAQHLELDERVAIKFLKAESLRDSGIVARFAREAKAALSIKSEHVARIMDVGTSEAGAPFIVMEYLEGQDLNTALRERGTFTVADVAEYMLHACEALAIAHSKRIVHRDIKPENLFLTTTHHSLKVVKVLDFGVSKAALTGSMFRGVIPLVETSQLMGTPLYMSPEQVRASPDIDARSDIWSLGLVIFEMLTGRPAFDAKSLNELCVAILERDIPPIRDIRPDVPEGLALAIQRCVQRDPAARFQNVGALANALLPFAPKRARVCAERSVAVLREAGMTEPELTVHSTIPPPTDEALEVAANITHRMRVGSSPMIVVEAAPATPPATHGSGRLLTIFALVAVAAVAISVVAIFFALHKPATDTAISAPPPPALSAPAPVPSTAPSAPSLAAAAPSPPPPAAQAPVTAASPVTAPAPVSLPRVPSRARTPDPDKPAPATSSATGAKPAPSKSSVGDEGPDLGY